MSQAAITKEGIVSVPKDEYLKLKKLEEHFGAFLDYFEHLQDIKEARDEVRNKKMLSQTKVFRELGL